MSTITKEDRQAAVNLSMFSSRTDREVLHWIETGDHTGLAGDFLLKDRAQAFAAHREAAVKEALRIERNRIHTALYDEGIELQRHGRAMIDRDVVGRIVRCES